MKSNTLYYGDCLDWMDRWIEEGAQESVDLIYLDPPFNSSSTYNMFFSKTASGAQFRAFNDTWFWDDSAVQRYQSFARAIARPAQRAIVGLHTILGECGMLAYLTYMAERLERMHRLLKPTGSLYLHCDPYASHYLKIILDALFGTQRFRNEIVWFYHDSPGRSERFFPKKHDTLFWYSKSADAWIFNGDRVRVPIKKASAQRYRTPRVIGGKSYLGGRSASIGKIPEDVWPLAVVKRNSRQALGYPTQKPEALLERIVLASSNESDVVLDPFCGSGTACAVAQRLRRHYLGIDQAQTALTIAKRRLA